MFNNDEEKSTKRKMRSARRKQFFTFLEGFFEKSNLESIKLQNHNIEFNEDEKEYLIKYYFKKFFNEPLEVKRPAEVKKVQKKGQAINTMLQRNEPAVKPSFNYNRIAEDHKDAFLGQSKGIVGSFIINQERDALDTVYNQRIQHRMKTPKVLIQTKFAQKSIGKEKVGANSSDSEGKSIGHFMESTLS